ncbi:tyrosine-protein phosphatase [Tautonia rosea]|uniref:tyrosine-protein phosphatase n=1 Tax=Tautonia rosea TaxID=2728037 RepID=UPI0028F40938|nr:tyrosine-protein phosphatase [Tautonia rosea]
MESDRPQQTSDRRARRLGRLKRVAVVLFLLAVVSATVFYRPLFLGNVAAVEPGKVYRCAQPKGNLDDLIAELQPGSILNLRGGSYTDSWYAAEVEATEQAGIDFYDFPMKATRRPSRAELLTLIDLLDRCRYPLVIHCKSGADRTGLASALYRLMVLGESPDEALEEFSIFYSHIPLAGPERLHEPFKEYRDWLQAEGKTHEPPVFRDWVAQHFRDEGAADAAPIIPLKPGSRMGPPPAWLATKGVGPKR